MAKEKAVKENPAKAEKEAKEITFTCKFCGETKPFSEMVIHTRYFPLLTSCRECVKILENIKLEEPPIETEVGETEETPAVEGAGETTGESDT